MAASAARTRWKGVGQGPFNAMFGPHFFNCSGNLRDWDRMADLPRITVPTSLTTSAWDYLLPEYARLAHEHLPNSELVIFRDSGDLPFWDAADRYHPAVLGFLKRHAGGLPDDVVEAQARARYSSR